MNFANIIGIAASVFTATSLIPQLVKIAREQKAEGVSLGMLIVLLSGLALWITYGALVKDLIIMISNGLSLLINLCVMALSIKYKKHPTTN